MNMLTRKQKFWIRASGLLSKVGLCDLPQETEESVPLPTGRLKCPKCRVGYVECADNEVRVSNDSLIITALIGCRMCGEVWEEEYRRVDTVMKGTK